MKQRIDSFFGVSTEGSTLGREVRAGVTTYLTMAYILFLNPQILSQAITVEGAQAQLLTATALAAFVGSLMMGLVARYPFALAPGMGINAYFAFTVVLSEKIPWQTALGAVFISGLIFILLSVAGVRELILRAIPASVRLAVPAGIGLFLAIIGLKSGGIVADHSVTFLTLGDLGEGGALLTLFGLLAMAVFLARRVKGAILIGIALTTLLAVLTDAPVYGGQPFQGLPEGIVAAPAWPSDLFLAMDIAGAFELGLLGIVFVFLFVDLFDTAGTLLGLSERCGVIGADGRLPRAGRAFLADAVATSVGAVLGTSSTTTYVESAAGVEEGGRTGLTAVVVALLFAASVFIAPLAGLVPAAATAPALVIIGAMMMSGVGRIAWDNYRDAVPAFITIVAMPFTYSIANGIAFGLISFAFINAVSGEHKRVTWVLWVLTTLLLARYVYLSAG